MEKAGKVEKMTSQRKRTAANFTEQTLLIAIICLEIAFVAMFAIGTGLLPRP